MDRLQAAIAQARTERLALHDAGASQVGAPGTPVDRWSQLDQIDLDATALIDARIVTREEGPRTAPFDVLRTRVSQLMTENTWKRLCVTSPGPECGKSTVTLNLAFSLARHPDLRVVVVDLDLRRPSIAQMLGLQDDRHVSRALQGSAPLADQMLRVASNLAVLSAKTPVQNPSEVLQGRQTRAMLDQIDSDYAPDIVLFDLPPMMVSDDALGFLPLVDCALLIAAAEQSTIKQVDACEQELAARSNVLGVVLNKCDYPGDGASYGYGYGDYARIA